MLFAFADCELDLRRQELRRLGAVVHVEPQVFDLLAFLLDNRDRIVSKDEILDAVWDGRIVSEAALSSRINAARKAIGDNGNDQALIRTVHKRGFRFVADVEQRPDAAAEPAPTPMRGSGPSAPVDTWRARPEGSRRRHALGRRTPVRERRGRPGPRVLRLWPTEDVIRLLGGHRWLRVLTRHATIAYRGREVDVREVGAQLGVRYLVQGSVRKRGDRVRITAELVGTGDARQLWSEATRSTCGHLRRPKLHGPADRGGRGAGARQRRAGDRLAKPPQNLDAWDLFQRGFWHLWGFTTPGFDKAEAMFCRAIEIEPGLARAHAGLGYVRLQKAFYAEARERPALLREAMDAAKTAVGLDGRDSFCRCVLGRAHGLHQRYEEAIAELEQTIAMNPSFAQGYFALAFTLNWCGRHDEAIALVERACELSPRDPHLWSFHNARAVAHFALDELPSAESFARQACRHPNATSWAFATHASILGHFGGAAEAAMAELLRRKPGYTRALAREDLFFCADGAFIDRYLDGLGRAGLPA
jgi:DNA-binding winged helix-turn-helix (wHTH) protein/tetratricopeptide (TPR) repeat protein